MGNEEFWLLFAEGDASVFLDPFFQELHNSIFLFEFLVVSHEEHEQDDKRQYVGNINADPSGAGELDTDTCVGFLCELIPSPSIAARAEEQVYHAAQREQVVGYDEVFQILDSRACADGLDAGPEVEAEHTGQGKQDDEDSVYQYCLFAGGAEEVHGKADDVFKYCDDGGLGGKRHKYEKERAENPSAGHLVEYVRQSDEHQPGTFTWVDAEGKAGRENDESCKECHHRIEYADIERFPGKGAVFADVAAEDSHCADAEA